MEIFKATSVWGLSGELFDESSVWELFWELSKGIHG